MLPPIGFIFPDGTIHKTDSIDGHCGWASNYLIKVGKKLGRNLIREYNLSRCDGEDIFVILLFGAAKIGATGSQHYIWYPENPRDAVKKAVRECKEAGYKSVPIDRNYVMLQEIKMEYFYISRASYNETVLMGVDGVYHYNPRRIGD